MRLGPACVGEDKTQADVFLGGCSLSRRGNRPRRAYEMQFIGGLERKEVINLESSVILPPFWIPVPRLLPASPPSAVMSDHTSSRGLLSASASLGIGWVGSTYAV